ncbi:MAG: prolyl oligopeptidase family serine peptidase [Colwellia sp.]|nr:prolyl oligopeptidase family serine peptidase [Colwellia sp.]
MNFRGSGGYCLAFQNVGHGDWVALMQDDITDATLAMIENGVANKNKICIYGASYGAYAALMGTVREPNLYKCAVGSMGNWSSNKYQR